MITETGSWFQEVEAWKEKELWPLDFVWRGGILNRRAKLPGRSVKVKNVWMIGGGLIRDNLKAKQSKDNLYLILCSIGSQWREWNIRMT